MIGKMKTPKTQDDLNQTEWDNIDNWSTIYFSKRDSRACVPKKNPRHGWTINFGSSSGARWIYYLLGLFFSLGCLIGSLFTAMYWMFRG